MPTNAPSSLDGPPVPSAEPLTPAEAANALKVSVSWLAKARMRGEGPPFMRVGRSIRYFPLGPWMETQRQSKKKR
jgi:Helix-turn-helix domain